MFEFSNFRIINWLHLKKNIMFAIYPPKILNERNKMKEQLHSSTLTANTKGQSIYLELAIFTRNAGNHSFALAPTLTKNFIDEKNRDDLIHSSSDQKSAKFLVIF